VTDAEFADELVRRLNLLAQDGKDVQELMTRMCEDRVRVPESLGEKHPTIQAQYNGTYEVGLMGLLNGLVSGPYMAAVYDKDSFRLKGFKVLP
jgi:hypothetical protein